MPGRITEYETIGADDLHNLDHEVTRAIEDGWQPFGSIAVSQTTTIADDVYRIYVQPMVRYD